MSRRRSVPKSVPRARQREETPNRKNQKTLPANPGIRRQCPDSRRPDACVWRPACGSLSWIGRAQMQAGGDESVADKASRQIPEGKAVGEGKNTGGSRNAAEEVDQTIRAAIGTSQRPDQAELVPDEEAEQGVLQQKVPEIAPFDKDGLINEPTEQIDVQNDASVRFEGHKGPVHCVALSPDCKLVLSGDQEDTALLWDVSTGRLVRELKGHKDTVVAAEWSPDGKRFATASMDGTVFVYRTDKTKVRELKADAEIHWLQWHPKGPIVMAGTADGTCWLWNAQKGSVERILAGHGDAVTAGSFSHDGKVVITGSQDQKVIVWSPKSGQPVGTIIAKNQRGFHNAGITCISTHPSRRIFISGAEDGSAWICSSAPNNVKALSELAEHKQAVEAAEFSTTHPWVFTASSDGTIIVSAIASGEVRSQMEHQGAITCAMWVVNSVWGATLPALVASGTDTLVRVWDGRNGKNVCDLAGHADAVLCIAASKDGKTIVSAGDDAICSVFKIGESENGEPADLKKDSAVAAAAAAAAAGDAKTSQ